MARESKVNEILRNAGYEPVDGTAIIVKYAPKNLSDQIAKFFSTEYYVMQICKESLVLVPFGKMSLALQKEVALEIPLTQINSVSVSEEFLNYRITLETQDGTIHLSAQQAELSEFRSSGALAFGCSGWNFGIAGVKYLEAANWHKKNMAATLERLKSIRHDENQTVCAC